MPSNPKPGASQSKVYRANPAPLKNVSPDPTGWDKAKFGDNRDLDIAGMVPEEDEPKDS